MKGKIWIAGILVVLLLSIPTAVFAAGWSKRSEGHRWVVRGEVIAIAPPALTVQTTDGPIVVTTGESTRFRIRGVDDPSLEDVQVGDQVICVGRRSVDGFHAFVVVVKSETSPILIAGQVISVEGNGITIDTPTGGSVLIRTDAETRFRLPGVEEPGPDDIEIGSLIGAAGRWEEEGVFHASFVFVPRMVERRGRVTGEVVGIEGDTLTIRTSGGRQARLFTDEATAIHALGIEEATLADVHIGDRVTAEVRLEEGKPYAEQVVVWPRQPARLGGEVAATEGTTIVLETPHGTVRVLTDGSTLFRAPGIEEPTFSDIQVGDRIGCDGEWEDEATFHALLVAVRRGEAVPGRRGAIRGRALSVGTDRLTVGTSRGPVTVIVDEETAIRVPGIEAPTLADIRPGEVVRARGQWNEDGSLQAAEVAVLGGEGKPPHGSAGPKGR